MMMWMLNIPYLLFLSATSLAEDLPDLPPPPNNDKAPSILQPIQPQESTSVKDTKLPNLSRDGSKHAEDHAIPQNLEFNPLEPDSLNASVPVLIPLPDLNPVEIQQPPPPPLKRLPDNYFCTTNYLTPVPQPTECPTCQGQCGSVTCFGPPACTTPRYCSCDALCLYYNDCCEGFEQSCPAEHQAGMELNNRDNTPEPLHKCVSYFTMESDTGLITDSRTPMITHCPDGSECPLAAQQWGIESDFNTMIPISDVDTGLTYINFHCARCNRVENMLPWSARFDIQNRFGTFLTFTNLTFQQDLDLLQKSTETYRNSSIIVSPPAGMTLRHCITSVQDKCSDSCNENPELVDLCLNSPQIFSANILHNFATTYKNYYCALCGWSELSQPHPDISYEEATQCGQLSTRYSLKYPAGSLILNITFQLDKYMGLSLAYRMPAFCEESFNEIIPEGGLCPTCQGKCGTVSSLYQRSRISDDTKQFCSCDYLCLFYNDCCHQFSTYCPDEREKGLKILSEVKELPINNMECFPTKLMINSDSGAIRTVNTFMISQCDQDTYPNETCTDIAEYEVNEKHYFYLRPNVQNYIPVTDPNTGIHYASAECARCNGIENFLVWGAKVNFDLLSKNPVKNFTQVTYFDLNTDLEILNNMSVKANVLMIPPENYTVRECYHETRLHPAGFTALTQTCSDDCPNKQLERLCTQGPYLYSTIKYRLDKTFKNPYCAICSWDQDLVRDFGADPSEFIECGAHGRIFGGFEFTGRISLTLIFDIDIRDGSEIGKNSGGRTGGDHNTMNMLGILTIVCISISIICLIIRITLQKYVAHYWSIGGKTQVQLSVALLMAFSFLLLGAVLEDYNFLCYICSVMKNFAFLASFTWMNTIAYLTWSTFRCKITKKPSTTKLSTIVKASVFSWTVPTILTILVVIIDYVIADESEFRPSFAERSCWYGQRYALLIYFGSPVALSTLINIILFSLTALHLRSSIRNSKVVSKQDRQNFQIYIRLFTLMGLTWILGFIVPFIDSIIAKSLFIVLNALQGLFIFVAFVCQKKVLGSLIYRSKNKSSISESSSSNNTNSSRRKTQIKRLSVLEEPTNVKMIPSSDS